MDYLLNSKYKNYFVNAGTVLNLIINGLPSKRMWNLYCMYWLFSFKPYYKWITF